MTAKVISTAAALVAGVLATAEAPKPDALPGDLTPVPYAILCGAVDSVSGFLRGNGEKIAARGITAKSGSPGLLAQFWVNPKTLDWTLVYIDAASGIACMVAAGTEFGVERAVPGGARPGSI